MLITSSRLISGLLSPRVDLDNPTIGGVPLAARPIFAVGYAFWRIPDALLMVIAQRTAEAHVTHILAKLGLRSRVQIAIWAQFNLRIVVLP